MRKGLVTLLADAKAVTGEQSFELIFGPELTEGKRRLINIYYERRIRDSKKSQPPTKNLSPKPKIEESKLVEKTTEEPLLEQ